MSNFFDKLRPLVNKVKGNKKLQFIIVLALSLLLLFIFIFNNNSKKTTVNETGEVVSYVTELENKLAKTLSEVEGAGDVSVVITVESGMETVLAMETVKKENSTTTEIKETPVIVNGKPIILKEKYPKIIGVLIVAKGAKNISVLTKIQQATISLLDININQIEILTMK